MYIYSPIYICLLLYPTVLDVNYISVLRCIYQCPFLITFICTSIGLVLFFVDSSKARKLQSKHIDVNELEMKETVSVENEDTCHAVSLQTMEIIKALKAKDNTDTAKVDEAVNYMLQLLLKSSENPYLGKVTMKLKEGE